jgi:hypothetical protein
MPNNLFRLTRLGRGCVVSSMLGTMSCAPLPKPAETAPAPPVASNEVVSPPVPPPPPAATPPLVIESAAADAPSEFPTECSADAAEGVCAPPAAFVREVCGGYAKPDVALVLFAKGSPWTRAYLRLNVDAWYTGSRSTRIPLKFDEEVIVLQHAGATGGIIVNGGGSPFDVMRLDGRCATLSGEEVTLKRPPAPKHPVIPWRQLDPRTRDALLSDPAVSQASAAFDEGCGESTSACPKAAGKLTSAILEFMARGGRIPLVATNR